jgi:hypothetical protein
MAARKAAIFFRQKPVPTLRSRSVWRRVAAATQPGELSPFDYPAPLVLDTSRAAKLGYRFGHTDGRLDDVIRQHDLAYV